jgi:hypothetical protein
LYNINFITRVGVQICDHQPSVRKVLWLTIYHTSELATSLASSTRLHTTKSSVGPFLSSGSSSGSRKERKIGPRAAPPVFASVTLGARSVSHRGLPTCSTSDTRVCSHMHHPRTHSYLDLCTTPTTVCAPDALHLSER